MRVRSYPAGLVGGRLVQAGEGAAALVSVDPGWTSRAVGRFAVVSALVDEAVAAARAAFHGWSAAAPRARAAVLRRFADLVLADAEGLAGLITREMGKPLWEAREEIRLVARKVEITLARGMQRVRPFGAPDGGRCRFRPRGVVAVLGPFNLPLHLPNGHIVPALATGNTVVFKPSEVTPAVALRYAGLFERAGAPPGVVNVVLGGGEMGRRLALHADVDAVLFTGSARVGRALTIAMSRHPEKLLALEMGGKNAAVVLVDADLGCAVRECLLGAFLTTGQRCTATSRIVVARQIADAFIDAFVAGARRLVLGYGLDRGVFMGPLATATAMERFERACRDAASEGSEMLLAGGRVPCKHPGFYVSPSVHLVSHRRRRSRYQHEEIFGPDVAVYVVDGIEDAAAVAEDSPYGLALSVFGARRRDLEPFLRGCRVGVLNWNRATVGASSALPFGGRKRSGNDRPTALFAADSCVYPVAMLTGGSEPAGGMPPGFPRRQVERRRRPERARR